MRNATQPQVTAIVSARMSSTRLPGKVLMPLGKKTVLEQVLSRVTRAGSVNAIVIATTVRKEDDRLAELAGRLGHGLFRGSADDVLDRFYQAARAHAVDIAVRVNGDNPLISPRHIDELVGYMREHPVDYASYRVGKKPAMLTGVSFFAEALTFACLERAHRNIADPFEREHVTLGIYKRPEEYRVVFLEAPPACGNPDIRLTVDTEADIKLLREIYSRFPVEPESVNIDDILRLLEENPRWLREMKEQNLANLKTSEG
ncbi:MAG: glycosyltransferase family protein [Candidatus Krumholzibacteriota bacterium]|nr:glycosyltransferase family protein [Candidatus Krumholzibacteriota bacterium]